MTDALQEALGLVGDAIDRNTPTYPQKPCQTLTNDELMALQLFVAELSTDELEAIANLTEVRLKDITFSTTGDTTT